MKVEYGNDDRGEYEYNGLNWRIIKRADTDLNKVLDQQRIMYYSANWQLLEERIDDAWVEIGPPDIDRHMQYVWGPRYIDDIILHREDAGGDGSYEKTFYHLTDVQFSTVAVIDDTADLSERVTYPPRRTYGEARHHYMADVDGDGDVDKADLTQIETIAKGTANGIGEANYNVDMDIDRDGKVTLNDYTIALKQGTSRALGLGLLSRPKVDNQIGWDGYVFNAETQQYHVRFRCYSPELGRWLERDPAGYVDSSNLYQYVNASPFALDPYGLGTEVWVYCRPGRSTSPGPGGDPLNPGWPLPANHCALVVCCSKEGQATQCTKLELAGAPTCEHPETRPPAPFHPIRLKIPGKNGERLYRVCHHPAVAGFGSNDACNAINAGSGGNGGNAPEIPAGNEEGDDDCSLYEALLRAYNDATPPPYDPFGPNSNTFIHRLLDSLNLKVCTYKRYKERPGADEPYEIPSDIPENAPGWDHQAGISSCGKGCN